MGQHKYPQYVKRKDINMHIKLDQTTKNELDKLCSRTGLNKSEVIRRSINIMSGKNGNISMVTKDFLKKNSKTLKAVDKLNAAINAIQLEYHRIGVNLNQIAKRANMGELDGLHAIQTTNETIGKSIEKVKHSFSILIKWLYA